MSWRTVVISNSAKLDYKLDFMVVRQSTTMKIHLSEMGILLIESTAVSITAVLMVELTKRKIKVIFCDEKRNPSFEMIGYNGSHDSSEKIRKQIQWSKNVKELIWTEIVTEKIKQQRDLLQELEKKEYHMLTNYLKDMLHNDETNREGHAAKVYFNAMFGMEFTRSSENPINAALNYGYSILLSAFTREIVAKGYLTQLGIFHNNMFNHFNLASDFMEPFRILIDRQVFQMQPEQFRKEEKHELLKLLNKELYIEGKRNFLMNAIKIYCNSVFEAIEENDISLISFYEYEL